MTFLTGKGSKVYMGSQDMSEYFKSFDATISANTHETTTFGKDWKTRIGGLLDGSANASGMFDSSANAVDPVIAAKVGSDTATVTTLCLGSTTVGSRCRMLNAKFPNYSIDDPVDDLITVSTDMEPDGGVDGGDILHAPGDTTSSAEDSTVDNGASSSNGGVAHLHVISASGTSPTLDVVLRHSADDSTYADLGSFTQATGATNERLVIAAGTAVNRYMRGKRTIGGTDTPTFDFILAFARR